jgi:hypothetical protein
MVEPLLPIFNGPGVLGQRFGQFFGSQTLLSNLTVANGAGITLVPSSGSPQGLVPSNIGTPTIQTFIQAGSFVGTTNASGDLGPITFPVAFPTAYDTIVVCNGDATVSTTLIVSVFSPSATGFTVNVRTAPTGNPFALTAMRLNWFALGH